VEASGCAAPASPIRISIRAATGRHGFIDEDNMSHHSIASPAGARQHEFLWILLAGLIISISPFSTAFAQDKSTGEVRAAIKAIWDQPDTQVDVDPVSVVGNYAMAGWTQGKRGGRALLRREHDKWAVIVCAATV
jgi:hypothetical protein